MSSLILTAVLAAVVPAAGPSSVVWNSAFGTAPLWNDGAAEVSMYEAVDVKYGIPRTSRASLIVVAEDLDRARLVKADHPTGEPATLRVLKLNHVRSIPTGAYTYQQMLSVFAAARSERLEPVKLTMTSHEWCGNSFVEWRRDRGRLDIRSYFETPGDAEVALSEEGALFYDALPLQLRALDFEKTRSGRLRVIETVFTSRPLPPRIDDASLEVSRLTGPGSGTWRVTVRRGVRVDTFDLETAFPHRLTGWQRSDGGSLKLKGGERFRYWEENAPGDERRLWPGPTR
jgi:hypothetical protein